MMRRIETKKYWPEPRIVKPKENNRVTCEIKHDERFVSLLELTKSFVLASSPQKVYWTSFQESLPDEKILVQGTGKIYLGSDKQIYAVEVIATLEEDARVKWTSPECIVDIQNLK